MRSAAMSRNPDENRSDWLLPALIGLAYALLAVGILLFAAFEG